MSPVAAYLERARGLLEETFSHTGLPRWFDDQRGAMEQTFHAHGHAAAWEQALAALPPRAGVALEGGPTVCLRAAGAWAGDDEAQLQRALNALRPWRKGPFDVFGLRIDAEWRSDLKWARLAPHLASLAGRRVLDVGCGNGYYAWRMLDAGARCVIGLDPGLLALMQFRAIEHYQPAAAVALLPLPGAALDRALACFESVFSMGVLYHQREPQQHLAELRRALAPGGELILETLIIDGAADEVLVPSGRYAQMRNVWLIPSLPRLEAWLVAAGFEQLRCVDITATSVTEQRATPWMPFHSLADFLDPEDPTRTVEGHPAPRRAIIIATRP